MKIFYYYLNFHSTADDDDDLVMQHSQTHQSRNIYSPGRARVKLGTAGALGQTFLGHGS